MDVKLVKVFFCFFFYYDTGQMNFEGCSIKDFIFTACILRKKKDKPLSYQAELTDPTCKKLVYIVPLEKVMRANEV